NSDVIWRPKSVVIRAGKINEKVSQKQREPIRDENPAIIQVSKFDYVTEKKDGETKYETKKRISHIEVLLEYYIEDLTSQNGFTGVIYIYKMAKNEGITESIYFNHTTNIPETDKELLFTKYVTGDTLVELSTNIRNSIKEIMSIGVSGIGSLDHLIKHPSNVDPSKMTSIYPFYFRPTEQQYQDNNTNSTYINEVIDRIRIRTRKGYGLLFDEKGDDTPTKNVEYTEQIITKIDKPNKNIIVLSDTNYFLAYGNNIPTEDKGIDFSKVSNYEISQTEINENIDSNTYSMVRGEKLHELLDTIYLFLVSHVHNPAEPAVVLPSVKQDLEQKFQDFKQNILSQKIRIN
ncbi:hypothetical protein EB155_14390, partial [archaeon]|nr:hypothetical protein [archaeon]